MNQKQRYKLKKLSLALLAAVLYFTLTGFIILPAAVKAVVNSKLPQILHRKAVVNKVKFNPYTLTLALEDLLIEEKNEDKPFVSFDTLVINVQISSIFKRALVIREFYLSKPLVHIERSGRKSFNFSDLTEKKSEKKTKDKTEADKKSGPPRFIINEIEIKDGKIEFLDTVVGKKETISDIQFFIPFLSSLPRDAQKDVLPVFSAKLNGKPIVTQAQAYPFGEATKVDLQIYFEKIPISEFMEYVHKNVNVEVPSGYLDVNINISYKSNPELLLALDGSVTITELQAITRDSKPLFKIPELRVVLTSFNPLSQNRELHITKIQLDSPEVNVVKSKTGQINLLNLVPKGSKEKEQPTQKTDRGDNTSSLSILLDKAEIKKGKILFTDLSKETPFQTTVKSLNATVEHFSTEENHAAALNVSAETGYKEYLALNGSFTMTPLNASGNLEVKNMALATYATYYQGLIPFQIEDGKLSLDVNANYSSAKKSLNKDTESTDNHDSSLPLLDIGGSIELNDLKVVDTQENPLLTLPEFQVSLKQSQPLGRKINISEVHLSGPEVHVSRNSEGQFNLLTLFSKDESSQEEQEPAKPSSPFALTVEKTKITNGRLYYVDQSRSAPFQTTVESLNVTVDQFSTLENQEAALQASAKTVNEEQLNLSGTFTLSPLQAEATLEVTNAALTTYAAFYQTLVPFQIQDGKVSVNVNAYYKGAEESSGKDKDSLDKKAAGLPLLVLDGSIELTDLRTVDNQENPLLMLSELQVNLDKSQPLSQNFNISKVKLTSPEVHVSRNREGQFNLLTLFPKDDSTPKETKPEKSSSTFALNVGKAELIDGRVAYTDLSLPESFKTTIAPFNAVAESFSTNKDNEVKFNVSAKTEVDETVAVEGALKLKPLKIKGKVEVNELSLNKYTPYYQNIIRFDIAEGRVSVKSEFDYGNESSAAILSQAALVVDSLKLKPRDGKEEFLRIKRISTDNCSVNLEKQTVIVDNFSTETGFVLVKRDSDGTLNLQNIFSGKEDKTKQPEPALESDKKKPWTVNVNHLNLKDYSVDFADQKVQGSVRHAIDDINLEASGISTKEGQQSEVSLSLKLNKNANLSLNGMLSIKPLASDLDVTLKEIDVVQFQPYFAHAVNLDIKKGFFNAKGNLNFRLKEKQSPVIKYKGNASLNRFVSVTRNDKKNFLKWESLYVSKINFDNEPLKGDIGKVALTDFTANLVILPDGTANIKKLIPKQKKKPKESSKKDRQERSLPVIINTVTLQGGTVNFEDRSIKPKYETNLMKIAGRVSDLSFKGSKSAQLELEAMLNNYSPFNISGTFNPFGEGFDGDLEVTFREIELNPLTPYAGKYIGYTLSKGKLTLKLDYEIENSQVEGKNRILFNQLTLGHKVGSDSALSLPLKYAVALLKDRDGMIDLNVPIKGNLKDPDFRIGKAVLNAVKTIITKIVSSPYTFLKGLIGSGKELSFIEFPYGKSELDKQDKEKLDELMSVLYKRPSLKLEIAGEVDPDLDGEVIKKEKFLSLLKAEKFKEMVRKGQPVYSLDDIEIEPQEYNKYLLKAYNEADFPKPRYSDEALKKLPPRELEKLLLTHVTVTEEDLRALAFDRSVAVRDYIMRSKRVESDRIFITESIIRPTDKKKEEGKRSRVRLTLKP